MCIAVALLIPACGDSDHRSVPRSASADPPIEKVAPPTLADMGPLETIEVLREYRARGLYSRIEECLPPEQSATVIAQIRSVDRLAASVSLLQDRVRERFGQSIAQKYSRYARVADIAGVFSGDATLLSAQIDGNRAQITYQVGGRLPLEIAEMVRKKNRWILLADPIEGIPEQLLKLAFLLERMAERVAQGDFTPEQLDRELTLRQSTIMRRLEKIVAGAKETG